jgi:prepilin-type N-terminal cleavage/methylation domain-containing protein
MSARRSHRREGFTLIELLIVVVIIGILAAIAIPKFANTKDQAWAAQLRSDLRNLATVEESHLADRSRYGGKAEVEADPYGFRMSYPAVHGTLTIQVPASGSGWAATATDARMQTDRTCGVYSGSVPGMPAQLVGTVEGAVTCW